MTPSPKRWLPAVLLAVLLSGLAQATTVIRYPRLAARQDPQQAYMLALLQLACDKAGERCQLQAGPVMVQSRAIALLQSRQRSVDVVWTMTDCQREAQLLPVPIPLYKGLMGWRLALLAPGKGRQLAQISTLDELRGWRAGQGHDWPDTMILRAAGIEVETSTDYESLFSMLLAGRFDYFPRGATEIDNEYQAHIDTGIVIDPYLLIRYPTAFYFFTSRHQPKLAALLHRGLELAVRDGSFDALFLRYNGDSLRRLQLDKRRIIELPNPLLPEATPLQRPELWYQHAPANGQ